MTADSKVHQLDQPVVLFDGACGICRNWVDFVTRHDRASIFRFAPLQSDEGRALLQKAGFPDEYSDSVVLIDRQGTWTHSTAALRVLGRLDGILRLAAVLMWLPRPLRDFVYRLVAKSRHRLWGCRRSCHVPSGKERIRFRG